MESFPLGAVRLTEQFLSDSPARPRRRTSNVCATHVQRSPADARLAAVQAGPRVVGIGGAVRNLAAAVQRAADGSSTSASRGS